MIGTPPVQTLTFALEILMAWMISASSSASNSPPAYSRGSRSSSLTALLELALELLMFRAVNSQSKQVTIE